uniref:hypothetical protein n=1 Tax=Wolbachia pipientis TaxID=955 RepID=UPI00397C560D
MFIAEPKRGQCHCDVIPVLDTGIQPLLCSHLVEIKSSGSQWALLHRSSDSR